MTPKGFLDGIRLIESTFDEKATKGWRLERIKEICEGKIDDKGFYKICQGICDNMRFAPVPADFAKSLEDWRKAFYYEHGHNYGAEENEEVVEVIYCAFCFDSGIVKVEHHEPDGFKKLMRCSCDAGKINQSKIPIWDNSLNAGFKRSAIDPSWFNPGITEAKDDFSLHKKIWGKMEEWKALIRKSEEYWSKIGYEVGL
jgi:hypothetical protein